MTVQDSRPPYLQGQTQRIASVVPTTWLPIFTKAIVGLTFILIIAGALVTGNKAALSDPTWPKFVGQVFPTRETWVGNLRYEDSHRLIAGTTAIASITLAIALHFKERRRWVRNLGWAALGTIILQALLGGLIVLLMRRYRMSVVHAALGQTYFCLVTAIAVFTSHKWERDKLQLNRPGNRSFYKLCKWGVGLTFSQLLLGATVRHATEDSSFWVHLYLHIANGLAVLIVIIWLALRAHSEYSDVERVKNTSRTLIGLVIIQVTLGLFAIFANRHRQLDEQPPFHWVAISTAHVATGALILATTVVLMIRARQALLLPEKRSLQDGTMAESAA